MIPAPTPLRALFGALILLWSAVVAAQPSPPSATIAELRAELNTDATLTDPERQSLEEQLSAAEARITQISAQEERQQELQDALDNGAQRIESYQQRIIDIEGAPQTAQRRLGHNPSIDDIEAEIGIVESQRQNWTAERSASLEAMAGVASDGNATSEKLAMVNAELDEVPAADYPVDGALAERVEALGQSLARSALEEQAETLQLELRAAPTLNNIRSARVAWLDAAIEDADLLLDELRETAVARRQSAASQRSAQTRRLLESLAEVRPELRALAATNQELIDEQEQLAQSIEAARRGLASARETRERIEQDASLTRRRLEVAGLEAELGEVMLQRLASLPSPAALVERSSNRHTRIADVSLNAIDAEQALRERADRSAYLAEQLGPRDDWSAQEKRVAVQLYEQQRDLLRENLEANNTLLRLLVDANQASDELLNAVEAYSDFLTGNLLWTRNYSFASLQRLRAQLASTAAGVSPQELMARLPLLLRDPPVVLLMVVLVAAVANRRRVRARLRDMLGQPISPSRESAGMLFSALTLTALKALPLPLLLLLLGRCAAVLSGGNVALQAVAPAMYAIAITLYVLNFMRALAGRLGAGRRLLKWNSAKADGLVRDMHWVEPLIALTAGGMTLGRRLTPTESGGPLAAAASFALATLIVFVAVRALRTGAFTGGRFATFCLRFAAVAAAAIAVLHLTGQLFAAHVYLRALLASIGAVALTLLVMSTLQRILQLYRLRLQQRSREADRERLIDDVTENDPTQDERSQREEALASLSEAHTQLLRLGRLLALGTLLWLIWSPALPALSVLDNITLWSTTDSTLPEGELRPITLSTLLMALLALVLTAVATRHLPPLVNVFILEWSKISAGARYATGMLMQYLIIGVGLSIAFSLLGFEWGKVQWLVAALGVGIGFGLQEIVANFISGLIVLFERPIRVGDIINAGGQDGVVSRINPRATVVETFEGKEVMIPNKELITSVVTNWSLSSPKLRLLIPVGVAYGSDVVQAMKIMVDIAKKDPKIMNDPEPIVTFEDFGDNALLLWLRCFATEQYPVVASGLRVTIYKAFEEAGISISFPQRDVHLDATSPIPVRLLAEDAAGGADTTGNNAS